MNARDRVDGSENAPDPPPSEVGARLVTSRPSVLSGRERVRSSVEPTAGRARSCWMSFSFASPRSRTLAPSGRSFPISDARRLGEQDLAAVARRADPGCADDVEPEVALVADRRLAGVQAHPHPHGRAVGPLRAPRARAGPRRRRGRRRGRGRTSRRTRRPACRPPSRRSPRTSRARSAGGRASRPRTRPRAAGAAWSSPRCR